MNPRDFDPTESSNVTYWKSRVRHYRAWFYIALGVNAAVVIAMVWLAASHTAGAC